MIICAIGSFDFFRMSFSVCTISDDDILAARLILGALVGVVLLTFGGIMSASDRIMARLACVVISIASSLQICCLARKLAHRLPLFTRVAYLTRHAFSTMDDCH